MPICVRCKTPLHCRCGQPQPIGQIAKQCPTEKGALWVHVTDYVGKNIPNVWAYREGSARRQSDPSGLVIEDPLNAGPCIVRFEPLTGELNRLYNDPVLLSKDAIIADGAISYVPFVLEGKARLKFEVVTLKSSPKARFTATDCIVNASRNNTGPYSIWEEVATSGGIADFLTMTAGDYTATIKFKDPVDDDRYEFMEQSVQFRLLPGEDKLVTFEVQELYTTVQLLAHCLATVPKQYWDSHTSAWSANYNGLLDDVADLSARVTFVTDTIGVAHAQADNAPTNLKVFMVPECFFQGKYGAYEISSVDLLVSRLQDAVQDAKWKDWVFVFGTVNGIVAPGEMFNISPVIRGGHGGNRSDYTRLIQKTVFSSELPSRDDLTQPPEPGLTRDRLASEDVNFQATENEQRLSRVIQQMLTNANKPALRALVQAHGLAPSDWDDIQPVVSAEVGSAGALAFVRQMRTCTLAAGTGLPGYVFSGEFRQSPRETDAYCRPLDFFLARWLEMTPGVRRLQWKNNAPMRNAARLSVIPVASAELPFQFQKAALAARAAAIPEAEWLDIMNDDVRTGYPEAAKFRVSWMPIFKKITELYLRSQVMDEAILVQRGEVGELMFISKRIAGPWISDAAAGGLRPAKKVQFGLEICADHSSALLKKSGRAIDIHLLPSCGMAPAVSAVAARAGGYIFNCDGWNRGGPGMAVLELPTGGVGAPRVSGKNPLLPHTAVGRGGGGALDMAAFTPRTQAVASPLAATLFGEGAGELHIYPLLPLPN